MFFLKKGPTCHTHDVMAYTMIIDTVILWFLIGNTDSAVKSDSSLIKMDIMLKKNPDYCKLLNLCQ